MLELFHWEPVSHSARVMICLAEVGADYDSHYVNALGFEHFSPEFLKVNPEALVPVLRVDGVVLTESSLINEFLAESFPKAKLRPDEPADAYNVQVWSKFIDYNLASSLATLGCRRYLVEVLRRYDRAVLAGRIDSIPVPERRAGWLRAARGEFDDALVENARRKVGLVLKRMEETLSAGDWLVGGHYSIADINAFAMIDGLRHAAPELVNADDAPHTWAWVGRIADRPAVRSVLDSPRHRRRSDTVFIPGPEHSRWG